MNFYTTESNTYRSHLKGHKAYYYIRMNSGNTEDVWCGTSHMPGHEGYVGAKSFKSSHERIGCGGIRRRVPKHIKYVGERDLAKRFSAKRDSARLDSARSDSAKCYIGHLSSRGLREDWMNSESGRRTFSWTMYAESKADSRASLVRSNPVNIRVNK